MPRFFVHESAVTENTVAIAGADARHIARSLRMAVGDGITVCTTALLQICQKKSELNLNMSYVTLRIKR